MEVPMDLDGLRTILDTWTVSGDMPCMLDIFEMYDKSPCEKKRTYMLFKLHISIWGAFYKSHAEGLPKPCLRELFEFLLRYKDTPDEIKRFAASVLATS